MKYQKVKVGKYTTVVDADVAPFLSDFYLSLAGKGYVKCTLRGWANRGKGFYLHRFVLGVHKKKTVGLVVDHKNRNKLDNRRTNLHLVTKAENALNCGLTPLNYWYDKRQGQRKRWVVEAMRGERIVARFNTEQEAKSCVSSLPSKTPKKKV